MSTAYCVRTLLLHLLRMQHSTLNERLAGQGLKGEHRLQHSQHELLQTQHIAVDKSTENVLAR